MNMANAADLTWNNGASTGIWNTTDANWTGSTWSNLTPDNAIFTTVGGTVTLASGVTAGSVSVGNTSANFANLSLSGGSLSASSLVVQGRSGNNGAYASNPTLTVNSNVTLTGSLLIGRSNVTISGGTLTTNRITANPASGDWANLTISAGTVTATNGVDGSFGTSGSNGTTATFNINLNGGVLATTYVNVANREAGANNIALLTFNGGTLRALADNANFIQTYGGGSNVYLSNSGATIDTNGFNVTIDRNLVNTSGQTGTLNKSGSGTLTLSGANSYGGVTTISGGTLNVATLSNYGAAGSLGNRASDSLGNVGILFRGGALQYTGSTAQSTNRGIRISTTGGGATIDASGSNPSATLTFSATSSADFFENNGNRSLTLTGSNTGDNTFAMAIGQAGGTTSFVKSGTGKWVLTNTSSYTGTTNVNAGTLVINGNISTSTLTTVASGATIGGSGTVGALTVQAGGFVNPGNSPGILNTGNYNQAGTLVAEITGLTAGTQHDQINVTGTVTLSGLLDIQASGGTYALDNMIFLILNDGIDAVNGTFFGLAQGATAATFGGFDWIISYEANSTGSSFLGGNDVALRAIPEPSAALLGGLSILALLRRRRR